MRLSRNNFIWCEFTGLCLIGPTGRLVIKPRVITGNCTGSRESFFGSPGKTRTYSTSVNRRCTSCSWESPPRLGPNASGAQPKYFFAATSQFVISPTLV